MANLLITGGAGFIGANFVHYRTKHYPEDFIVVLDSLTYAGNYQNLIALETHPRLKFVRGNICDRPLVEDLLRCWRLNTIINFAAESHVDRSIFDPELFVKTNIEGTHSLLAAARNVWLDGRQEDRDFHFHHLSTVEVYGNLNLLSAPVSETRAYAPTSPFGASKAAADHLVRSYHQTYGLPVTISNSPNNFGRFHFPDKLIPLVVTSILQDKELPIYGDGQQVRDWLYVQDHCRGIDHVLSHGKPGETYHIATGNEWTNLQIVEFICDHMDKLFSRSAAYRKTFPNAAHAAEGRSRELIRHVGDRPGHDRRYAMDAGKIMRELNWRPRYTFKGALEYTIGWYLRHLGWLETLKSGGYEKWLNLNYDNRGGQGQSKTCCTFL